MKKFILACFAILSMVACKQKQEKQNSDCIIIDLANSIQKKSNSDFQLNSITQNINVIPIETNDSTLFDHIVIAGYMEENIAFYDIGFSAFQKAIYFMNTSNGKVSTVINSEGEGPEEYKRIDDVLINNQDSTIFVSDFKSKKINQYTFGRQFVKSIKNDSIGTMQILENGNSVVSYSPFLNMEFSLGIYDKIGNLLRTGLPKVGRELDFDMVYVDLMTKFNGECYYKQAHSDTLFRITSEFDEPALILEKGDYKMPLEVKADRTMSEREGNKYVQQDHGQWCSKYYFLTYYYENKKCYEIWDTENSTLIYKGSYGRTGGVKGIPVTVNEKTIQVWPSFVSDKSLYCIVEDEDAIALIPSLPKDTNPIILEIELQ